ncbi:hypothetical protein EBU94_03675, partial [bacterium]|nr:hypothetical protein [bacterium]
MKQSKIMIEVIKSSFEREYGCVIDKISKMCTQNTCHLFIYRNEEFLFYLDERLKSDGFRTKVDRESIFVY